MSGHHPDLASHRYTGKASGKSMKCAQRFLILRCPAIALAERLLVLSIFGAVVGWPLAAVLAARERVTATFLH